jgi:2-dehydropantoate 2-reductase
VPTLARMVDLIHDIEDGQREQSADLVNLLLPA